MRRNLVNEAQVFGKVINSPMMGGSAVDRGSRNSVGPTTQVTNNGYDHGPSFGDKNPGAMSQALEHGSDPFYFAQG